MKHTIIIIILSSCSILNAQINSLNQDSFKLFLNNYVSDYTAPGVVASVFTSTQLLNIDKVGVRNIKSNEAITLDDKFHLGSNSKAMTGFIAGALVEKGLISWDTKFFDILPELKPKSKRKYRHITLADLLSHTAHVLEFTDEEGFEKLQEFKQDGNEIEDRLVFCKWLVQQKPIRKFKQETYTYSNAGYTMAAAMLEKVSGLTWNELIVEELAKPLGIEAGFDFPNREDHSQPWGHYLDEENNHVLTSLGPDDEYSIGSIIAPAGDIHMNMKDYVRYLQANMRGLQGHDDVLQTETYIQLHYNNFESSMYGYGWGVAKVKTNGKDYRVSTHNGSGGTYYCHTLIIPGMDIGIAIMSNAGDDLHEAGVKVLRKEILSLVRKQLRKAALASK